jgi:predicted DNA-binding transcriptional regulator AlpA
MRRQDNVTTEILRRLVNDRLMTIQEVADLFGISRQRAERRVRNGELPPALTGIGPLSVWDKAEVLRYAERGR